MYFGFRLSRIFDVSSLIKPPVAAVVIPGSDGEIPFDKKTSRISGVKELKS